MIQKDLDDLRAQVQRIPIQEFPKPYGLDGLIGYWFMETLTDHNLTGTSEWTSTFEDPAEPRTISYILCAGGYLPPQVVGGDDRDCRWRIAFQNDGPPYSVDVTLDADTMGGFQTVINGSFTHYAASSQELTWNFRTGLNEVCIMIGDGAERLTFTGRLFDGRASKWYDMDWGSGWDRRG